MEQPVLGLSKERKWVVLRDVLGRDWRGV